MSKVLDDLTAQYGDSIRVEKIDVMQNSDLARKYEVKYVPTLVFLNSTGGELGKEVGYMSLEELLMKLDVLGIHLEKK
ncbi:MAG TPA: thioredoxin [Aminobacterium sp.]|jgi:thioredoxin 1|uniref:thioredoxin family protein n=1 Tax=Aminobacterium TaxID=81466 RepID=UPI00046620F5|nr:MULTISPECIES: thioredoxin family protein [Aminobacterium]HCA40944.1 thioredoxin [Aminobacterium sp.]